MTSEPMGHRIDRLIKQGFSSRQIVDQLGCNPSYVYVLKSHGGYDAMRAYNRNLVRANALPRPDKYQLHPPEILTYVVADYKAGMSYREIAEKHNLRSRNVVAGIIDRHRKAA